MDLAESTKEFTLPVNAHSSSVSVLTDSSLVTNFSEISSVSFGLCCPLQIATAP